MGPVRQRDRSGNWQKYTSGNPIQQRLISGFLASVKQAVDLAAPHTIADVGCAEGLVAQHLLADGCSARFVGADLDLTALCRGRTQSPHLAAQQADIYHLPYRDRSADLVLCLEVLEHLIDPARAVGELRRVAAHYCLISVPHEPLFRLANLARGKNAARLGDDPEHCQHWNGPGLIKFLQRCGLAVRWIRRPLPWLLILTEVDH